MSEVSPFADLQRQCSPARILAVSKLQPPEKIRALYDQGQREFGENYVQEALGKQETLKDLKDIRWHLIGHLQKNKVKQVVGKFALIHSVDSLALAQAIDKQAALVAQSNPAGIASNATCIPFRQPVLIEVNLAGEETKTGFSKQQLKDDWSTLRALQNIQICGLMTMPPLTENAEEARPYFHDLKVLQQALNSPPDTSMTELSMGTSGDFRVALQEGATIVRLGTILFGERTAKR